jgi:hypothetical protein
LYRERPSRHLTSDIFVGQVASGLSEGQDPTPELFEAQKGKLSAQGLPDHVTSGAAGLSADAVEKTLEVRVKANGDG